MSSSRYPWPGVIEYYSDFLPVSDATPRVTLLEGNTPLIPSVSIGPSLPGKLELWFKYEGVNPTGSFKDRGMTMAISKAAEAGAKATMCASTGNTSAAAAAYSTRAGMLSIVLIPAGYVALGKLAQALSYGARTIQVDGNFDDCLRLVREITDKYPVVLVNSLNPYRMDGQKTAAFEVCDALGEAPAYHALPVGNAGNITAYWWGYKDYQERGITERTPRMLGFQAAGAAPLVSGEPVSKPETVATAIRIGNPARWQDAMKAVKESDGILRAVTDEEILAVYQELAAKEGIFCEPASAASVAGVMKVAAEGFFGEESATVVCTLTGHGLKDPDRAVSLAQEPEEAPAETKAIVEMLGF
ncbi:MAG: threonine synthase [candidate division WS1 bacterium]|nr:threonine synthase [candidate division WS1 bacterium]